MSVNVLQTTTAGSILLKTHLKRCTLKAANDAELQEWTNAIREAIVPTYFPVARSHYN